MSLKYYTNYECNLYFSMQKARRSGVNEGLVASSHRCVSLV